MDVYEMNSMKEDIWNLEVELLFFIPVFLPVVLSFFPSADQP